MYRTSIQALFNTLICRPLLISTWSWDLTTLRTGILPFSMVISSMWFCSSWLKPRKLRHFLWNGGTLYFICNTGHITLLLSNTGHITLLPEKLSKGGSMILKRAVLWRPDRHGIMEYTFLQGHLGSKVALLLVCSHVFNIIKLWQLSELELWIFHSWGKHSIKRPLLFCLG